MNYFSYKTLHLLSLAGLFLSFGLITVSVAIKETPKGLRKFGFALHGTSWLALFITSFGLVSALGLHQNFPAWAKAKTVIWVLLGGSALVMKWQSRRSWINILVIAALGSIAIWLAVAKPTF